MYLLTSGAQSAPYCRVYIELVHKSERLFLVRPERSRAAAKSKGDTSTHSFDVDTALQRFFLIRAES